jgi:alpha-L-fucosidase
MEGGYNPSVKKAQLKELCTLFGPIEFFWMDHAAGDGGLSHKETVDWIHEFQPDCFVGFNIGEPAGRLDLRERGKPGPIGDERTVMNPGHIKESYEDFLVAEFTYPILPESKKKGAQWFYSSPENDTLCHPAGKIFEDYLGAKRYGNIFSLNVGPDYDGNLREIDVETLQKVGKYISGEIKPEDN